MGDEGCLELLSDMVESSSKLLTSTGEFERAVIKIEELTVEGADC